MLDLLLALTLVAAAPAPERVPVDFPTPTPSACDEQFNAFDGNKDNVLSMKEYVDGCWGQLRFIQAPTEAQIRGHKSGYTKDATGADRNKDGKLSRAEHRAMCQSGRSHP